MSEQVNTADGQDEIQHMDYIYMVNDNKLIIRMNAELDHHLAEEMRQVIDDVIDKRGVTHIVFDFTKVDFMDSAGIGLLIGRYKLAKMLGGVAEITNTSKSIEKVLEMSGITRIIPIIQNSKVS